MKRVNFKALILVWTGIICCMFALQSCEWQNDMEGLYADSYGIVEGNYLKIVETTVSGDTVFIIVEKEGQRDTVYLDRFDTIWIDSVTYVVDTLWKVDTVPYPVIPTLECVSFEQGFLILKDNEGNEIYRIEGFEKSLNIEKQISFSSQGDTITIVSDKRFNLRDLGATRAEVSFSNGADTISSYPRISWANYMYINGIQVNVCEDYVLIVSEKGHSQDKNNAYLEVEYKIVREDDHEEVICSEEQIIISPLKDKDTIPVEEYKDTAWVHHEILNDSVIAVFGFKGSTDPTVQPTRSTLEVPMVLEINTETLKEITTNNVELNLGGQVLTSTTIIGQKTWSEGDLTVTCNEYKRVYSHTYTAGNQSVTAIQEVFFYGDFEASMDDAKVTIATEMPEVSSSSPIKGETSVDEINGCVTQAYAVDYTAKIGGWEKTAKQEVEVTVNAISFAGETVLMASRTVTFFGFGQPSVFTCVLTQVNKTGAYKYYYQQYGSKDWTGVELTIDEYNYILENINKENNEQETALARYYHMEDGITDVGTIRVSGEYAYYNSRHSTDRKSTVHAIDGTMYGKVNRFISGDKTKETGSQTLELNCLPVLFDGNMLSPEERIIFM